MTSLQRLNLFWWLTFGGAACLTTEQELENCRRNCDGHRYAFKQPPYSSCLCFPEALSNGLDATPYVATQTAPGPTFYNNGGRILATVSAAASPELRECVVECARADAKRDGGSR